MISEIASDDLLKYDLADVRNFEPWWKIILGNKAILPVLWQMFPNHPNLLPAYYDDPKLQFGASEFAKIDIKHWVSKPLYGREGLGVFRSKNYTNYDDFARITDRNYGDNYGSGKFGKSIYQAYWKLPII